MQPSRAFACMLALSVGIATQRADAQTEAATTKTSGDQQEWTTERICRTIATAARANGLPRDFFARLIWTESRFDIAALSPKGAQGIAQFMPATAEERGLADPYDPAGALPASAALLADLKRKFGNYGLAAAAYNAGSGRVSRWLKGNSSLPFETQDYVAGITGRLADSFRVRDAKVPERPLKEGQDFMKACRDLPILKTRFRALAQGPRTPWGVQVAGHFSRDRAMRSWTRVRTRLGIIVSDMEPALYRQPTPRGMKSKWTVRLGTKTRIGAIRLCNQIRGAGGFCIVRKNRT